MEKLLITLSAFHFCIVTDCFSQNTGIGTTSPTEKLEVAGNIKSDTLKPSGLKLTLNAGAGKILTSDAAGNASWQTSNNAAMSGNVGYGVWGDCATNGNISEYYPVADSAGASNDFFGWSISISGNYAVIGAYRDGQGSATIYQFNGTNWVFMQKITDATGAPGDEFGYSVSVSGNYVIVGSPSDDGVAGADQGSASIYQFNGTNWVLMQKITDLGPGAGDLFGSSVSISGNNVIVGAWRDDGAAGTDQGSVSFYQFNGTNWLLTQKSADPAGAANDGFGISVSISGNYAVVGASGDDGAIGTDQGSASFYNYNGTGWVLMQKRTDATGAVSDFFGSSVSVSGNYAIVGAPYDDGIAGSELGSVSVYRLQGSSWNLMQKINNPAPGAVDLFGQSVAISDNYMMVGAMGDDGTAGADQGSVTIYQRVGSSWSKLQLITDPGGFPADNLGAAAAIDEGSKRFVIGAPGYAQGAQKGKVIFGKIN